jgi:hypothetical protein
MTRIMAFAFLALLAAPAAAADRTYQVRDFDRLIVEGPYDVHLVVGGPTRAAASGSRDGLERVTFDVQGQTLRIRRNRSAWVGTPGTEAAPLRIEISTRFLRSARLMGPARLDVEGARGINVELAVEGGGRIRATGIAADNLALGLRGSGSLEAAGTAGVLSGQFEGTGNVEASRLIARQAAITTSTGGSVAVTVNGPAAVTAYGIGEVAILGLADCTLSGPAAAQVRCAGGSGRR